MILQKVKFTLLGNEPGIADYHIWPHLQRMQVLQVEYGFEMFPEEKFPKLNVWFKDIANVPAVRAARVDHAEMAKAIKQVAAFKK